MFYDIIYITCVLLAIGFFFVRAKTDKPLMFGKPLSVVNKKLSFLGVLVVFVFYMTLALIPLVNMFLAYKVLSDVFSDDKSAE